MDASFFSKPLSQSECRIKITSQLLIESECRNLGHDLTQKTQTNKMVEAQHNADKHYLLSNFGEFHIWPQNWPHYVWTSSCQVNFYEPHP